MSDGKPAARAGRVRSALPTAPFDALLGRRDVAIELARRDILGRYHDSAFGLGWSLLAPLLLLVVYTFAFGQILGGRWNQSTGSSVPFGIVLFLGIMVHGFFAEVFARSPKLMVDNANFVKKIVFPLPVLSWVAAMSAGYHFLANLAVFIMLSTVVAGVLSFWVFLVPLVMLPLFLLTVATSWTMAAVGVYFRDIGQAVPVIVTALLFLSSAIVPVDTLDPRYQRIFRLNPLTFFIDQVREVALWGRLPDWSALGLWLLASLILLYVAHAFFRRASRGFADVL